MPLQLHNTTTEAAADRTLRERAAAHHTNTPASAGPQLQLCLPALLSGALAARGGAGTETSVPPVRLLPGSSGLAPRRRRWSRALGGSREQAQSPEPCPHPRPCSQPGTCLYSAPCPQHTVFPMSFLMLCCPEGVCLSFPWQSSAGCPRGPHPRPQAQPPPQSRRRSGLTGKLSRTNPIRPPQLGLCNGECVVMAMPPLATPVPSSPRCPRCCPTAQRTRTPNTSMARGANPSHSLTPLSAPRQDPLPAGVPKCTSSGP